MSRKDMAVNADLCPGTLESACQNLSTRPTTANTSVSESSHLTGSEIELLPYQPSESQLPLGTCAMLVTIEYDLKPKCLRWKLSSYDLDLFTSRMPFFADVVNPSLLHEGEEEAIEDDFLLDQYDGDSILFYAFSLIVHRHRIDALFPEQWKAIYEQFLTPQLTIFVEDRFMARPTKLKDYPIGGTIDICWVQNKHCYQYSEGPVLENIFRFRAQKTKRTCLCAKTERTKSTLNQGPKVKSSLLSDIKQKIFRCLARSEVDPTCMRTETWTSTTIIQALQDKLCMKPERRTEGSMTT